MNEDKLKIAIIVGTKRQKRESMKPAKFIYELCKANPAVEPMFVDPADFNLPDDGSDSDITDPKYTQITREADAFFIVVPEYNHSYPGSLKRLLDSEYKNYKHKAVALAGVSSGRWGGVRAIEALIHPLRKLGLVVTLPDVQFPNVQDLFDESGKLLDEAYVKLVNKTLDELIWMGKALKQARNAA